MLIILSLSRALTHVWNDFDSVGVEYTFVIHTITTIMGNQKLRQAEGLLQVIHDPASGPVYVQLPESRR